MAGGDAGRGRVDRHLAAVVAGAWQADAGDHMLEVRATDNAGAVQTDEIAPPAPDGATGYHVIAVTVS